MDLLRQKYSRFDEPDETKEGSSGTFFNRGDDSGYRGDREDRGTGGIIGGNEGNKGINTITKRYSFDDSNTGDDDEFDRRMDRGEEYFRNAYQEGRQGYQGEYARGEGEYQRREYESDERMERVKGRERRYEEGRDYEGMDERRDGGRGYEEREGRYEEEEGDVGDRRRRFVFIPSYVSGRDRTSGAGEVGDRRGRGGDVSSSHYQGPSVDLLDSYMHEIYNK